MTTTTSPNRQVAKGKAQHAMGRAEAAAGRVTSNDRMRMRGVTSQVEGSARQVGGKLGSAAKTAGKNVGRLLGDVGHRIEQLSR